MKICNRCKVEKEDSEFIVGKTKCLKCYKWSRDYYQRNREREIARAKKNLNKNRLHTNEVKRNGIRKNPVSYMLWQVKSRAKKSNIPFNLEHRDIIIPPICPVLGIRLEINSGHSGENSPSVDRIVPELGYVKGNIKIISNKANSIKNNASIQDLEKVLEYVKSFKTSS